MRDAFFLSPSIFFLSIFCYHKAENHAFNKEYNADINSPRNYFQIAQELALISKILSLTSLTPTIFVVIDNSKCSLMRALIIG